MATQLFDASDRPVVLGREIARGGEGTILEVEQDTTIVAKIYHTGVDGEKAAKLAAMARLATDDLSRVAAWPTTTLHRVPRGQLVGILMPRIDKAKLIHQLYSPAERKIHFPRADWSFLVHVAMNCAAAFDTVHRHGHVVGDVNQSGVAVSEQGIVRFIDCDSFQIRGDGKLFHCVVGVPEYTAPELQGARFATVERTTDHDGFGLALLIFHLIFMGRHPFAGRHQGAGDMPPETAISQGCFAFSRLGQSDQIVPPPHSLTLDCLPGSTAELFERAFQLPRSGTSRPTAAEWRQAMAALKASLKTCTADRGHRYPSHLPCCPWCKIMVEGGPNFFTSVQVAAGDATFDLPALDARPLWAAIEVIPPPSRQRPTCPQGILPATPLAANVQDQLLMKKIVAGVGIAAIAFTLFGIARSRFIWITGTILAAIFVTWWLVLALHSELARELSGRRKQARALQGDLEIALGKWDRISNATMAQFESTKNRLQEIAAKLSALRNQFEQEKGDIEHPRPEKQLEQFLEGFIIRQADIDIDRAKKANLCFYGVETAADVQPEKIRNVPGLSGAMVARLLAWREELAKGFVFDPNKPVPVSLIEQLVIRYRQMQDGYKSELVSGTRVLSAISERANSDLSELGQQIEQLMPQARQAQADAKVKKVQPRII